MSQIDLGLRVGTISFGVRGWIDSWLQIEHSSRIFHLYHQRHGGVSLQRTSAHNNPYLPSQPQ